MRLQVAVPVKRKKGARVTGPKPVMATVVRERKKKPSRGTLAAAKKIAKAQGPEVKGPFWKTLHGLVRSGYSYGGATGVEPTYVAPTFTAITRSDWAMGQGTGDNQRVGNSIIPVAWKVDLDITLPQNCWQSNTTIPTFGNTADSTDIFYGSNGGRTYAWPDGAPFTVHLFLGRPRNAPDTTTDDTATIPSLAFQRFFSVAAATGLAGATAATGQATHLDRPFQLTDHWEIKKRWKFTLSPERCNYSADYSLSATTAAAALLEKPAYGNIGASKHHYPSTKSLKIDLTKYLPKKITYDDAEVSGSSAAWPATNNPGNVKPLFLFALVYPKGSYTQSRYTPTDAAGTLPTVPWASGANIAMYFNVRRTITFMDP